MSLDSNYETAKAVALRVLHEALNSAASHPKEINPKGELQAILQDILPETPSYETEEKGPRDAENRFESRVFCMVTHWSRSGASKRKAEVAAAADALDARAAPHDLVTAKGGRVAILSPLSLGHSCGWFDRQKPSP